MSERARILVVDDEPDVRTLFTEVIAPYEADVDTASNPAEAAAKLSATTYSLVITDLMMGLEGNEGMRVLETVKRTQKDTPVVLMTAYGSDEVLDRTFHQGALSYLEKPVLLEDVFRTLDAVGIPRKAQE